MVCKVFHKFTSNSSPSFIEDIDESYKRTITPDGVHMSYISSGMEDQKDHNSPLNSISFPYIPGYFNHIRDNSIPNFPSSGYGIPDVAVLRAIAATNEASLLKGPFKVDEFSNQSMVSQDTGLSTEVNAEISSETSKHEIGSSGCYEDLEGLSSAGPIDLECLWNY